MGALDLELGIQSVSHPNFSLDGVTVSLARLGRGPAELRIARVRAGELVLDDVRATCAAMDWSEERIQCSGGRLIVGGKPQRSAGLRFTYHMNTRALEAVLEPARGERWAFGSRGGKLDMRLENARVERLYAALPMLQAARLAGALTGSVQWESSAGRAELAIDLSAAGLSFSDESGEHAGENLSGTLSLRARQRADEWHWQSAARWEAGEAYLHPFYIGSGGHHAEASGRWNGERLAVETARLSLAEIGSLLLSARWEREAGLVQAEFNTGELALERIAPVLIKPLLQNSALPELELEGGVQAAGVWSAGQLSRLDLKLAGVSAAVPGRFSLRGVDADIPWRSDAQTHTDVRIQGGAYGRVALGAFSLPVDMHGTEFEMQKAQIPVLDGAIVIEGLSVARRQGEWEWRVGGSLHPISMRRLTEALEWPSMAGVVSASIPRVSYSKSTLVLDGALIVQVFDGYVAVTNLRVVDPLGTVPRLYADAEARHIDLGQLTETFSFGSITGYVDGFVQGFELAGKRPQSFSARIESSPGSYRKRISQRAVENISALGGAGAAAAIQRSLLRFFDEFGYSRLGLSCVLRAGVCQMDGIEPAQQGYVIVKGGGIPAINVIGYNRRVDWDELLSRLQRVTAGNRPVIQ